MRRTLLLVFITALLATTAFGKCGNRIIQIEGRIENASGGALKITVAITPDPNWDAQPPISITNSTFSGTILFDSTKAEGRVRDDCSRVPDTVEVALLKDGQEVDRVRLKISRDFIRHKLRDYKLRTPIVLRSRGGLTP